MMAVVARFVSSRQLIARAQTRRPLHRFGQTCISARAGVAMEEVRRSAAQRATPEASSQGPACMGAMLSCLPPLV